jgi:bifunctional enzyme CysN/CysC
VVAERDIDRQLATADIEQYLREHERKELLRLVVVGSVDDGKSTLIGRLLHDTGMIFDDQLSAVQRASANGATRAGESAAEVDFSLFTDGLRAEREQGITIDVAYRYFTTARRKFIIADTPGHVQYTRNMATGASTASVGVILVDARLGVLAQTRRHAYLAALLGIPHLVACVNKMDLVGWDRGVFERIAAEVTGFAGQLGIPDVRCVPISALRGDQIVARGTDAPWYDGPTLLDHLDTVPLADARNLEVLRFPVQYVIRPGLSYRGFAGQIASGTLRPGDAVIALPSGRASRIASIDTYDGPLDEAFAPMSVTVRLTDEIDVSRGDMLVAADRRPRVTDRFDAMVVWMAERPLDPGRSYLVKHASRIVRADVAHVAAIVDPDTLAPRPADRLELNDIGRVTLHAHRPLFVDAYRDSRTTGAFIVIDSMTNDTVAAGMILPVDGDGSATAVRAVRSQVSPAERATRLGQVGGVVEIGGRDDVAARARAYLCERVLFDAGLVAAVAAADVAPALADAGLLAIVARPGLAGALVDGIAVAASADDDEAAARAVRGSVEARASSIRPRPGDV